MIANFVQLDNGLYVRVKQFKKLKEANKLEEEKKSEEISKNRVGVIQEMKSLGRFKRIYQSLVECPWKKVDFPEPVKDAKVVELPPCKCEAEVESDEEVVSDFPKPNWMFDEDYRKMLDLFHQKREVEENRKMRLSENGFEALQDVEDVSKLHPSYKSRYCQSFFQGTECEKDEKCTFAHNMGEINPIKCLRKEKCTNKVCYFIHPWETTAEYTNRLLKGNKSEEKKMTVYKSRFCKWVRQNGVCTYSGCNFAHNVNEFRPVECRHKMKCRIDNCWFFHPDETKLSYLERVPY